MADNMFGNVPIDLQPEMQNISQQQKLSQMLLQQAFQQPQGQMISGRYVAPAITQQLAPLLAAYAGSKGMETAEQKQLDLAKTLREGKSEALSTFQELMSKPETRGQAMAYAAKNPFLQEIAQDLMKPQKLGEGENLVMPSIGGGEPVNLASGGAKYRAPIQIDTGTSIELRDPLDPTKIIARMPKSQMPTAGQVVETANGPMLVNTHTGQAQPVMAGGQPIAPKLSAEQSKDITAINQQRAAVTGALKLVEDTPSAFSFGRGLAGKLPAGETLAGRTEKPEQTEARSAVFNIVSKVINERAGAAQSAQELARLNAFLPSELDNAESIKRKLNGFNKYLNEQEKGTRVNPNMPMTPQVPQAPSAPQIDPKLLQYMTPEQRKLFGG